MRFGLAILTLFSICQSAVGATLRVHCDGASEIPTNYRYEFTKADFAFESNLLSPANAIFKFRSKKSGKAFAFKGQVQFVVSAENADYLIASLDLHDSKFKRVDFTLWKNPNDGALGYLLPNNGPDAVSGALFRCKLRH